MQGSVDAQLCQIHVLALPGSVAPAVVRLGILLYKGSFKGIYKACIKGIYMGFKRDLEDLQGLFSKDL